MVVTDHLGNEYKSLREMCRNYGIVYQTFRLRVRKGMSLKEALTTKVNRGTVKDHLGNVYMSKRGMCKHYGIKSGTLDQRIANGWSLEKALTEDINNYFTTDHLGNKFSSIAEMCKHYNISYGTYRSRIDLGWSLKDALTIQIGANKTECVDHLGNKYSSKTEMCKAWGYEDTRIVDARIDKHGWSLEEALTGNRNTENILMKAEDHLGNKFHTKKDMCEHWGVTLSSYYNRIDSGWSVEKALTTKTHFKSYEYKGWKFLEQVYESSEGVVYYICSKQGNEEVLSKEEIEEMR